MAPTAKMPMPKRPIPNVPEISTRHSTTSVAYIDPDGDSNYAMPGEEQTTYYMVNDEELQITKDEDGDNVYSSVQDGEENVNDDDDDDEKIYAIVVPPPPSLRSSFLHRHNDRRL